MKPPSHQPGAGSRASVASSAGTKPREGADARRGSETSRHWTEDYLGIPFAHDGDDLSGFNCWGMFRHVELARYGVRVPVVAQPEQFSKLLRKVPAAAAELGWEKVAKPLGGDAVLMAHHKRPSHVGLWVDDLNPPRILHCLPGAGVVLHTLAHLRIAQWRIIAYYRPIDMAASHFVVPGHG